MGNLLCFSLVDLLCFSLVGGGLNGEGGLRNFISKRAGQKFHFEEREREEAYHDRIKRSFYKYIYYCFCRILLYCNDILPFLFSLVCSTHESLRHSLLNAPI